LVEPDGVDLAGCAVGRVPRGARPIFGDRICAGDEIVLVGSSGLHQNGASLARAVARADPDGLSALLPGGRSFGDALLDPGVIYVGLVEKLLGEDLDVHYLSHLTGHGLRKLMRADREVTYRVTELPPVPPVLQFLVDRAALSPHEAYATLNMGAGFAVVVASGAGSRVVDLARESGYHASLAGVVEAGPRRVLLDPVGVEYAGSSLELR
jgi:phosphoribosylformylglycinamidine cyclo-ligase